MLKLIVNPTPPPSDPAKPCTHGYASAGNCIRCTPPPRYSPLNGSKSR